MIGILNYLAKAVINLVCAVFLLGSLRGLITATVRDYFKAKADFINGVDDEKGVNRRFNRREKNLN